MHTARKTLKPKFFVFFLFIAGFHVAFSQGEQTPVAKEVRYDANGSLIVRYGYQEYLPEEYDTAPDKEWPLIIQLVGLGERGDGSVQDLDTITGIAIPRLIREGNDYPFLIMSPQPTGKSKSKLKDGEGQYHPDTLAVFIDHILENYRVDPERVYITAFSAAVRHAYRYIMSNSKKVTAYAPIAGNGQYLNLCKMKDVPVWAFHNLYDNTIISDKSKQAIEFINNCDPPPAERARLTIYETKGHDAWTRTYNGNGMGKGMEEYDSFDETIFDWFLSFSKTKPVYANAGEDKTVLAPETSVVLKGSSTPTTGISYQWTQISGPDNATLENQNTPTLTASDLVKGTYEFMLTVTDAQDNTDEDKVRVHVKTLVADAGEDVTVTLPVEKISLTGKASGGGDNYTYNWKLLDGPNEAVIDDTTAATISVSNLAKGTYGFKFTVKDETGEEAYSRVLVYVKTSNDYLAAYAGKDTAVTLPLDSLTLKGTGKDPYNNITGYIWEKVSGPEITMGNDTLQDLTLTNLQKGSYEFMLTVLNDNGGSAWDVVEVIVFSGNEGLAADAGEDTTVTLPVEKLEITGKGISPNPDNEITAYAWEKISGPQVNMENTDSATLSLSNLIKGDYVFKFTVRNNNDGEASDTVKVSVKATNDSLVADAGKNISVALPKAGVEVTGSGSDPYNEVTGYAWKQLSGPAVTLTNSEQATLSVSDLKEGTYEFELTVTNDNGGSARDTMELTVLPKAAPDARVAAIISPKQDDLNNSSEAEVTIEIENAGNVDLEGIEAGFQVNNQAVVTEKINEVLAVGEIYTYTFTTKADLSSYENYLIRTFTKAPNDVNTSNDTLTLSLEWLDPISKDPYSESFENSNGGWRAMGENSSWQRGEPGGEVINTASEGKNIWATNLNGSYNENETSFLLSPVFNFSEATSDPVLTFDLWWETDNTDLLSISISTDGGTTWTTLGNLGDSQDWFTVAADGITPAGWTGNSEHGSGQWITVSHPLDGAAGQQSVMIRFEFISDGESSSEGVGIDNIHICQAVPTVASIADITTSLDQMPFEIPLTISNVDLSTAEIFAMSDNQQFIPDENIQVIIENGQAKLQIHADKLDTANISVVVQQGCMSTTNFKFTVNEVTGIGDDLEDVAVVYPNPSNGIFFLKWKEGNHKGADIRIYTAQGALIQFAKAAPAQREVTIDLSTQAQGNYILHVQEGSKIHTYQLIKQ